MQQPFLSIIIPTLNEAADLDATLHHIRKNIGAGVTYELLICDAGSTDQTIAIARQHQARVLHSATKSRPVQLNLGASQATGKVLYFLHADTLPPADFGRLIEEHLNAGFLSGCFRLAFDHEHWVLKFSGWASRFNARNFQFGDQSLYVQKEVFWQVGRYNENLLLMEDVEMVTRIKDNVPFTIMPEPVITSARKYVTHGVFRTELTHLLVFSLYLARLKQQRILSVYKWALCKR